MKHRNIHSFVSVFRLVDTSGLADISSTICLGSNMYLHASFRCRISIMLLTTLFQPVLLRGELLQKFCQPSNMSLMELTIFLDFK